MNAGLGVSEGNYMAFERGGYVDAYRASGAGERATWEPTNRLNASGPHRACPPQRIDHVFVRGPAVAGAGVVLDEEIVEVAGGTRVTLSDHYGVMVELKF